MVQEPEGAEAWAVGISYEGALYPWGAVKKVLVESGYGYGDDGEIHLVDGGTVCKVRGLWKALQGYKEQLKSGG